MNNKPAIQSLLEAKGIVKDFLEGTQEGENAIVALEAVISKIQGSSK